MSGDVAVVLAAGKGTRMRSTLPKVLHSLAGKPLIVRVVNALQRAGFERPIAVVGYGRDLVEQALGERCSYVAQREQRGTGHALRLAVDVLPAGTQRVLVVNGDDPMIGPEVFRQMLDVQKATGAAVVLLTVDVDDTRGFGRVLRNGAGKPMALLQESDLSPEQRTIREVNLGAYLFDADFVRASIPGLQPHPPKDEFYLTDLVALSVQEGREVQAVHLADGDEALGINDLVHLEEATRILYRRTNRRLMEQGVTIMDTLSTFIDEEVEIEPDTVIYPFTMIVGASRIGGGCMIGPGSHIVSSRLGRRCRVVSSMVEEATVGDEVTIGPYAHLRPGADIGSRAEIGNFAEIKRSSVGQGTRVHHFSYLGDATIGANVNIGAGTITMNYDGASKHTTVIEDGAFIGSDSLLRAPVRVGRGAITGGGAVVTHDIPDGKLAVGMPARVVKDAKTPSPKDPDKPIAQEQNA